MAVPVTGATNVPFVNLPATATGLKEITANFRGIDSGIMGWAEISVRRLPDF